MSKARCNPNPPAAGPDKRAAVKIRLIVAYDGAAYQGWQRQKVGTGVQEKIEEALARLFPSRPVLCSSSRTDTGVHALGMAAHFEVAADEGRMPASKLLLAVNAWLPEDIRILSVRRVPASFHARFDASGKQYRYFVWNHPAMNPLLRRSAWHVPRRLDPSVMRKAAALLCGRHDFRAFAANPGYEKESTVRTLGRCDVKKSGHLFTFIIEGDGFLYKMCRGIVGTLVQAGQGKIRPADLRAILASKDRRVAGMSAPAHGLVLWKVFYKRRAAAQTSASRHAHRPG